MAIERRRVSSRGVELHHSEATIAVGASIYSFALPPEEGISVGGIGDVLGVIRVGFGDWI